VPHVSEVQEVRQHRGRVQDRLSQRAKEKGQDPEILGKEEESPVEQDDLLYLPEAVC